MMDVSLILTGNKYLMSYVSHSFQLSTLYSRAGRQGILSTLTLLGNGW
jgi:hypothetical protein